MMKNQSVAEQKRKEGNKAFQTNESDKALQLYSQAVIRAPSGGEDLALSLANRSAVLFHLEKYELCLQDISLALANGYPKRLLYKVYDRKGQCLLKMGFTNEAKKGFEEALDAINFSDLEEPKKRGWKKDLNKKIEHSSNPTNENVEAFEKDESIYHEKLFKGQSSLLPKACAALSLKYSKDTGRYMAASENIPAGKILVRERPFSSVVMQEKRGRFCEHCFKSLIAPIPCDICSGIAFCSLQCRDEALKTYHKWECPYLNLFKGSGMSLNCLLSLRVITERGLEFFKQVFPKLHLCSNLPSEDSPHNPDDYCNFYNLVGLEEQRSLHEFLKRTLMTVFLLKVLQHAGFFPKRMKHVTDMSDDEVLIGSLLLRHLQMIQFNAHEVSGIAFDEEKSFRKCKSVFLGLAVYPTVSFFNHSCYPAVGRYFDGKEMTIVNLRPLQKDEMVAENYGPIFTHSSRVDRRRKLLSRYWFDCKCEACTNDWPMYDDMSNSIVLLKNQTLVNENQSEETQNKKKNRRRKRKNKILTKETSENELKSEEKEESGSTEHVFNLTLNPFKAHKDFELGKSLMDEFKREEAISAYIRWVESSVNRVKLPLKDLHLALEALRLLVAARGSHYVTHK